MTEIYRSIALKRFIALLALSAGGMTVLSSLIWAFDRFMMLPHWSRVLLASGIGSLALFWFLLYREAWLRRRVQHLIRKQQEEFRRELAALQDNLRSAANLDDLLQRLSAHLPALFQTDHVLIFYEQDGDLFAITGGTDNQRWVHDVEVDFDDPLVLFFKSMVFRQVLTLSDLRALRSSVANALIDHHFTRLAPLVGGDGSVSGGLAIGGLRAGAKPHRDLNELLMQVANAVAWALERSIYFLSTRREDAERGLIRELNKRLNSVADLHEFLDYIMDSLKDVVPYDAGGIFLVSESKLQLQESALRGYPNDKIGLVPLKIGQGLVGQVIESGEAKIVDDVATEPRYLKARSSTRSTLIVPITIGGDVIGAINLECDRLAYYSRVHLEMIRTFASQAAVAIQTARLYLHKEQKEQLDAELQVAGTIQRGLLPHQLPSVAGFELHADHHFTGQVGGDFYDLTEMPDGALRLAIGDAAGKGISGAILMTTLTASLAIRARENLSIEQIVTNLNDTLSKLTEPDKYVTFFYGMLTPASGELRYCNAGHNPPVIIRADGSHELLETGGPVVGFYGGMHYSTGFALLNPGDLLVLYTDGVTETLNQQEEEYGEARLFDFLAQYRQCDVRTIEHSLTRALRQFAGDDAAAADDRTMVLIKRLAAATVVQEAASKGCTV